MRALVPASPAAPPSADGVRTPPPEPSYPAVRWEVVTLMDGLVLLVNPAGGQVLRRVAADIYRYYGARPTA